MPKKAAVAATESKTFELGQTGAIIPDATVLDAEIKLLRNMIKAFEVAGDNDGVDSTKALLAEKLAFMKEAVALLADPKNEEIRLEFMQGKAGKGVADLADLIRNRTIQKQGEAVIDTVALKVAGTNKYKAKGSPFKK